MQAIERLGLVVLGALLLGGCAATKEADSVKESGFLGATVDGLLKPTHADDKEAFLRYINPNADFANYNALIIDPVQVWRGKGSDIPDLKPDDVKRLQVLFRDKLVAQLSQVYQIVEQPGPATMRLRVALTEAKPGHPVGDVLTSVIPIGIVISEGMDLFTGTQSFVGQASAEAELVDSNSGEVLAAGIDRQIGQKYSSASAQTWAYVYDAFEHWAIMMRMNLDKQKLLDVQREG